IGAGAPGRLRMFLSGTLAGGAVSLNTLRPVLSIHCHWARAEEAIAAVTASAASERRARGARGIFGIRPVYVRLWRPGPPTPPKRCPQATDGGVSGLRVHPWGHVYNPLFGDP